MFPEKKSSAHHDNCYVVKEYPIKGKVESLEIGCGSLLQNVKA